MIYTSYFNYSGRNPKSVAISRTIPEWYKGARFIELAPPWDLVSSRKYNGLSYEEYKEIYEEIVLSKLDPHEVSKELEGRVLLCWEKNALFCHRTIVANWITYNCSVFVSELD